MKHAASALRVIILVFAVAIQAQTSAQTDIEVEQQSKLTPRMSPDQELLKLENKWADAWVKSDVAFLYRIMANNYQWTAPEGYVLSKADNLEFAKSGVITSWELANMRVHAYRDAAVVSGISTVKETYKGKDFIGHYRWTHMWIKDYAGRWELVAGHSSRIAPHQSSAII